MAWDTKLGSVVADGRGPDAPDECEMCRGSGQIIVVKHHPWRVLEDAQAKSYWPCKGDFPPSRYRQLGWAISAEDGEEMECFVCMGEGGVY